MAHTGKSCTPGLKSIALNFEDSDPLPYTDPSVRYHMSQSTKFHVNIASWLAENKDDPCFRNFLPRLKDHILARLLGQPYSGDEHNFSDLDRSGITFVNNRIYRHKVVRINYTTYDVRRAQDSLNPRTHADFICLSHEEKGIDAHPYWYGRIIGIFHSLVRHVGPLSRSTEIQRLDFLWVRWFGRDPSSQGGFAKKRLHRIGFLDNSDDDAFGFLDPTVIVRGIHLIPAFAHGKASDLLGQSTLRQGVQGDDDWLYYYVNLFVDRDIFMRFLGGGVGHKAARFPDPSEVELVDGQDNVNSTDCREPEPDDEGQPSDQEDGGSEPPSDAEANDREEIDFMGAEDGQGPEDEEDVIAYEGYGAL